MARNPTRTTVVATMAGTALALLALVAGCSAGMGGNMGVDQHIAAGNQGLANFDAAHKAMMAGADAGTVGQAMTDMETGMQMMEQGAGQMMGGMGSKGTMSGM